MEYYPVGYGNSMYMLKPIAERRELFRELTALCDNNVCLCDLPDSDLVRALDESQGSVKMAHELLLDLLASKQQSAEVGPLFFLDQYSLFEEEEAERPVSAEEAKTRELQANVHVFLLTLPSVRSLEASSPRSVVVVARVTNTLQSPCLWLLACMHRVDAIAKTEAVELRL